MRIVTKGLVIKEQTIGESDRLVTLLTADYGLVKAFVRRAKQMKSKLNSATTLFAYSEFGLYRTKDAFVVDDAVPIDVFFDLRKDIERLSLAQYFAQLAYEMSAEEQPEKEMLVLTLNSLYLLCKGEKNIRQIKAVFELRAVSLGGYMPAVLACDNCGTYETDIMYFDTSAGKIYCENCPKFGAIKVPKNVITAVRYICLTEPKKIFGFNLDDNCLNLLVDIAEKYALTCVGRNLSALDFYKGLLQ